MSPLSKDETRTIAHSLLLLCHYTVIKTVFIFLWKVLLAERMVADVTETRYVIPENKIFHHRRSWIKVWPFEP